MKFILRENLKTGMRLGRPIYSKDGTLLYNVGSRLTEQGIISVNNFGVIGLYILEEAEPVVLLFDNNEMLDLSDVKKHGTLAVDDVVKTLDNRWVIDRAFIDAYMASLKRKKQR